MTERMSPVELLHAIRRMGNSYSVTDSAPILGPGHKPHAYDVFGFPRWMVKNLDEVLAVDAENDELKVSDYEEVLYVQRDLVRQLDVAMNGEEGAAKQASLCDLIEDARRMRAQLATATGAVDKLSRRGLLEQIKLDRVNIENDSLREAGVRTAIKLDAANIENDSLRAALEKVMIGGNHLSVHGGPGYKMDTEQALEYLGAGPAFDRWVCWAAIMNAGDTLDAFEKLKQAGET